MGSSFRKSADEGYTEFKKAKGFRSGATVPAEEILKVLLRRHGLDTKIAKYQFVSHWEELVGKRISTLAKPECIKGKTLVIRVKSSSWSQELTFHKKLILARVNKFFNPDEMLTDIRFIVGALPKELA